MSEPDFTSYANAYKKHAGVFGTIEKEYFKAKNNKALTSSTVKTLTNKTKTLVKNIGNTQTRFVTEYDKYGRSLPLKRATGWKFWEKKNIVNFPKNWAELNRKLVNVKPKTTNDPKKFFSDKAKNVLKFKLGAAANVINYNTFKGANIGNATTITVYNNKNAIMMTLRKNAAGIWSQKHYTNTKNTPLNLLANKYNGDILNTFKYAVGKNGTNKTWANLSNPSTNLTGVTFIKVSKNGNALFVLEKVNNKWRTKNVSNWKTFNATEVPSNAKDASYKYSLRKNGNKTYVALNNLQVKENTKNIYVKKNKEFMGTIKINNAGVITFNAAPSTLNTSGLNKELSKLRKFFQSNSPKLKKLFVRKFPKSIFNQAKLNGINNQMVHLKQIKPSMNTNTRSKIDLQLNELKMLLRLSKNPNTLNNAELKGQIELLDQGIKARQLNINKLVKNQGFNFDKSLLESQLSTIAMEIGFLDAKKDNGYQNKIAKLRLQMANIQTKLDAN